MTPQWIQAAAAIIAAYAALMGGLYAVVTRPIFNALEARFGAVDARLKNIEDRLTSIETKLDTHSERITRLESVRWK